MGKRTKILQCPVCKKMPMCKQVADHYALYCDRKHTAIITDMHRLLPDAEKDWNEVVTHWLAKRQKGNDL